MQMDARTQSQEDMGQNAHGKEWLVNGVKKVGSNG